MLEKEVFSSPVFKSWKQYLIILVKIDFSRATPKATNSKKQNQALRKKLLTVLAYPTVVMLNAEEQELGRKTGYFPGSEASSYVELTRNPALETMR